MELELILEEQLYLEFLEFLREDPEFQNLNEDMLNEGKILDKIRWKLALFSLRFLREESLNNFLRAYYADKNGNDTKLSREWLSRKKREKLKKVRELANSMKPEEKNKVANSPAAVQLEKSAVKNGVLAVAAGGLSVANYAINIALSSNAANVAGSAATLATSYASSTARRAANREANIMNKGMTTTEVRNLGKFNTIISLLSTLSTFFISSMWGALIIAAGAVVRGAFKANKAVAVRRDEIMADLIRNRDAANLKECLELFKNDFDTQKKLVEMYQYGDPKIYEILDSDKDHEYIKEELTNYSFE